jgi:hypothetical protein
MEIPQNLKTREAYSHAGLRFSLWCARQESKYPDAPETLGITAL